ncbi:glycoside hydrolase family 18 protein [Pseudovibrio sp. SPO723]|uniref:glycoside hydrolase family 18 protein n=1 Tax=Nesiotobacter zosterae TaxID=392721 RepID=UPI0029C30880|nr:glycoside hydrolase family 18 protein [Pseudovibrio sp. SPO723]MDX5593996.1 glycoside hydrolase family 18 protein [Pseudovibrio sp. SPO723]
MSSSQIVIYADNTNVPITGLIGSSCTIAIQAFLYSEDGSTLQMDYPLQAAVQDPSIISSTKENGKRKVLVSVGGEVFASSAWKAAASDVSSFASQIAAFVEQYNFDGVDIDWEDTGAISDGSYDPTTFLVDLSSALKSALPSSQNFITHAPQCPYFYTGSDLDIYSTIAKNAGDNIDLFNIQYYNNDWYVGSSGSDEEEKVAGLTGSSVFPSSIMGIKAQGLDVSKMLVGKPTTSDNASSGYLDDDDLASYVVTPLAKELGSDFGGVMGWQFATSSSSSDNVLSWIEAMNSAIEAGSSSTSTQAAE